ncbi:hypothetical protein AAFF_G00179930 [Aldrovandia affinis]|uniref:Ig-like domain-containing protein n=1 Tax=Aldrovandia affinis TaxID=143900 RepID=A0AAD7SZ15_9TELE|nr:hypothetical protein AAFF_G00179930 [Aldrovandia affinis]
MGFPCITLIFVFSFMKSWEAVDRREVRLGDDVMLSCTISCYVDVTWMRHNPGQTPTVVLVTKLGSEGNIVYYHQHDQRFTGVCSNRSIALKIENITDSDFALYFCAGNEGRVLHFGNGTQLLELTEHGPGTQPVIKDNVDGETAPTPSSVSGAPHVCPVYATLLGCALLGMICAVVAVHLKT